MEAILLDAKRALRSILGMAHADSGASKRHGVSGLQRRAAYRSFGDAGRKEFFDMYGRSGMPDAHGGRLLFEFFAGLANGERHPL